MDADRLEEPSASRKLRALAARRWRIALALTTTMMVTYFGFLFVVAWAKSLAGAVVVPGLSLGILFGVLVIVVAWIVTGIYVSWANARYDEALASLREVFEQNPTQGEASSRLKKAP